MSNIDLIIQDIRKKIRNYMAYIVISIIIIIVAFLVHTQINKNEQKLKNEIYNLNVQIKSLEEMIDNYDRKTVNQ